MPQVILQQTKSHLCKELKKNIDFHMCYTRISTSNDVSIFHSAVYVTSK